MRDNMNVNDINQKYVPPQREKAPYDMQQVNYMMDAMSLNKAPTQDSRVAGVAPKVPTGGQRGGAMGEIFS